MTKPIRIWSIGCSTGQEPYSIAMLASDLQRSGLIGNVEIVASDVSGANIGRAKDGVFTNFEVQRGLPTSHLVRYFSKTEGGWRIEQNVRELVNFDRHNILDNFSDYGLFDVIFCRNVISLFDDRTQRSTLSRLANALEDHALAVFGCDESLPRIRDEFVAESGRDAAYKKRDLSDWAQAA